jgi:hypothetical protein
LITTEDGGAEVALAVDASADEAGNTYARHASTVVQIIIALRMNPPSGMPGGGIPPNYFQWIATRHRIALQNYSPDTVAEGTALASGDCRVAEPSYVSARQ